MKRINIGRFLFFVLLAAVLVMQPVIAGSTWNGQDAPDTSQFLKFTSGGHVLGFTPDGYYAVNGAYGLRVEFLDANHPKPVAAQTTPGGTGLQAFSSVSYPDLWDGISARYDSPSDGFLRSTYTLAPQADPAQIHLRYNAPVQVNQDGSLTLAFEGGQVTESAPIAWQEVGGQRQRVEVRFETRGRQEVGFVLGDYDPRLALIIDPTYNWHTFLGGVSADLGTDIALDSDGNIYVTGYSQASWDGPGATAPLNPFSGTGAIVVVKLNSAGTYQWHTFMGGSGWSYGEKITVDGNNNVFVGGISQEGWYGPGSATPLHPYGGGQDVVVIKFNSAGAYQWHAFFGSAGTDDCFDITTDGSGNVLVAGYSDASWNGLTLIPPINPHQSGWDMMILKINDTGQYQWHTFLGGAGEAASGIVAKGSDIFITGFSSAGWDGPNSTPPIYPYSGSNDLVVLKLNSAGAYQWHLFLGSPDIDSSSKIVMDASDNLYIAGIAMDSWNGPGSMPPLNPHSGNNHYDILVVKLNNAGIYQWHTFFGSANSDHGIDIGLDSDSNPYISGLSFGSWDGPNSTAPLNPHSGGGDTVLIKLNNSGAYQWHTFYGSATDDEQAGGIAVNANGTVHTIGDSAVSWDGPGTTPPLNPFGWFRDIYVIKMSKETATPPTATSIIRASANPSSAAQVNFTVTFSEPVTGVGFDDFGMYIPGLISASMDGYSGGGTTWTITVNTGSGSGNLQLILNDNNSILDGDGNPLGGPAAGDGDFTTGETYVIQKAAPTDISLDNSSVAENQAAGTLVGNLSATDPDPGDSHTYSFCGGADDASFQISGNQLLTNATFDYETKNSYSVCIRTTDSANLTFDKTFPVSVTDVYESPIILTKTFRSLGGNDGWVLESSQFSGKGGSINTNATTVWLGDDAGKKQYRSVLAFNTSSLPDNAVITKVTLKIKKQGIVGGGNPVTLFQGIFVELKQGFFGTTAGLVKIDFNAPAQKKIGPFKPTAANSWYTLNLTTAKAYVNKLGTSAGQTQIRLSFKLDDNNNTIANYLSLYSGNAPLANRPELIIEYYVP
jgi:hypothetical protein